MLQGVRFQEPHQNAGVPTTAFKLVSLTGSFKDRSLIGEKRRNFRLEMLGKV